MGPEESAALEYVMDYGPRCRDCADENGVCPLSGLPCENARKAVGYVIRALKYGIENGYIKPFAQKKEF